MDALRETFHDLATIWCTEHITPISAQFIPIITDDPSVHVINFCRTPSWIIPRASIDYLMHIVS